VPSRRPPIPPVDDAIRQYLRALAAKGGKRGGKARWKGTTADERSRQMKAVRAQALVKKRPAK
jgi:hypothetical protein